MGLTGDGSKEGNKHSLKYIIRYCPSLSFVVFLAIGQIGKSIVITKNKEINLFVGNKIVYIADTACNSKGLNCNNKFTIILAFDYKLYKCDVTQPINKISLAFILCRFLS